MEKINLFMIPYAGGSATMYTSWLSKLRPFIDIIPLELSGRGKRFGERLYSDMESAVTDLYQAITTLAGNNKYAIFGHSFGGILAFELVQRIQEMDFRSPEHVFFSGTQLPTEKSEKIYNVLENQQFIEELVRLGAPKMIVESEEFVELIPIVRADFYLVENRTIRNDYSKLKSDVSVLSGFFDTLLGKPSAQNWISLCENECSFHDIQGDHLFIYSEENQVIKIINNTLASARS